jgi:hypothetical protein
MQGRKFRDTTLISIEEISNGLSLICVTYITRHELLCFIHAASV